MPTRDLVDALISGDSIAIENTFNAAMSDKVSAALDSYRVQLATKMFVPKEESIEQNTDANTDSAQV
jgi:hypothetical protein